MIISFSFFLTQWMPIEEYMAQPYIQGHESFKYVAEICSGQSKSSCGGFCRVPTLSSSGKKSYTYFNKPQLQNKENELGGWEVQSCCAGEAFQDARKNSTSVLLFFTFLFYYFPNFLSITYIYANISMITYVDVGSYQSIGLDVRGSLTNYLKRVGKIL